MTFTSSVPGGGSVVSAERIACPCWSLCQQKERPSVTGCGRCGRPSLYMQRVSTCSPENRSRCDCGTTTSWSTAGPCACSGRRRSGSWWPWGSLSRYVANSGSFSLVSVSGVSRPTFISGADTGQRPRPGQCVCADGSPLPVTCPTRDLGPSRVGRDVLGQCRVWPSGRLSCRNDFMSLFVVLRTLFRTPLTCSVLLGRES